MIFISRISSSQLADGCSRRELRVLVTVRQLLRVDLPTAALHSAPGHYSFCAARRRSGSLVPSRPCSMLQRLVDVHACHSEMRALTGPAGNLAVNPQKNPPRFLKISIGQSTCAPTPSRLIIEALATAWPMRADICYTKQLFLKS